MAIKPLKPSKRSRHERKAELKRAMQPPPKVFPQPEPAAPVFKPLGYAVLLYPAPLQAAALVNEHEGSQARLLKYESILLLVLRLLYLQKRESLAASADQVLVTVEEVQTELQKMNLPRRLDQKTLENLMRTLRRYNLARPVGRLSGLDSRIEVFPTVLLALPDADLADAAAESGRTRTELGLYERPEEAGEGEE